MPLWFTGGGLRGTVVGDDATLQGALEALPPELDVELVCIGDYHPDLPQVFASLTDRQQAVLRTAIREGYYDHPRTATQADLAGTLGIATSSVSEHLGRIEARVFSGRLLGTGTERLK